MVYYLGMLLPLLLVFIAGGLVGAVVYYQLDQRKREHVFMNPDSTDEVGKLDQAAPAFAPFTTATPAKPEDPRLVAAQAAVQTRIEQRLARILAKAKADGRITNDGAEDLFCISDRTASTYLSELTNRGLLMRQGAGRGTFYTPTEA